MTRLNSGHSSYCSKGGLANKILNPIAFRMAKTPLSFGHSECNRVKNSDSNRVDKDEWSKFWLVLSARN